MTDIRNRFVGGIAKFGTDLVPDGYDLSDFIQRFLLFDHYIFDSFRLREFPLLVGTFGFEGVMSLLESDRLSILFDAVFIGQEDASQVFARKEKSNSVILGPFSFGLARFAHVDEVVDRELLALDNLSGLSNEQIARLKNAVHARLVTYEKQAGLSSLDELALQLEQNHPITKVAVAKALSLRNKRQIDAHSFALHVVQSSDLEFYVTTDVASALRVNADEAAKAIGSGFLAMGSLNRRIETMNSFQAMTGTRDEELSLLTERLSFLEQQFDPDQQIHRFERVLKVTGFPEISAKSVEKLNLERLLEICESRECKEFRSWLWTAADVSDEELQDQFTGLSNKMSVWAHGNVGKSVRWVAATGVGFIPVLGNIIGGALGLSDTFLLEKIFPQSGPITFLNQHYASLFRE